MLIIIWINVRKTVKWKLKKNEGKISLSSESEGDNKDLNLKSVCFEPV